MLRESVAEQLRADQIEQGYLFPDYEGYCFANVPHTIASVLGADTGRTLPEGIFEGVETDVRQVVVVLVDGFGLTQWRRDCTDHPFLQVVTQRGTVTPLTSIYPSETAAAITTFHTGRLPAQHGAIGWNVYEPTTDESFELLPFLTKDEKRPSVDPDDVFDAEPIYPALATAGIESHHVIPFDSTYEGATAHTYSDWDGFRSALGRALRTAEGPSYTYAYLPHVDHVSHAEGTQSKQYQTTVAEVCDHLQQALVADLHEEIARETLLVVTADHGHVDTDTERNVDISDIPGVTESLQRHADGTPIRFAGSPRNVHLHLEPDAVESVRDSLLATLDAQVFTQDEVLERGLFGDVDSSETFRRRLGDLVLTHRDLGVWWDAEEPDELHLVGMHGGLHPNEMLVPFAAVRLSELRD